jgi:hypothetical protein
MQTLTLYLDVKEIVKRVILKREIREKRDRREIRLEILYGLDEKKSGKREINKN